MNSSPTLAAIRRFHVLAYRKPCRSMDDPQCGKPKHGLRKRCPNLAEKVILSCASCGCAPRIVTSFDRFYRGLLEKCRRHWGANRGWPVNKGSRIKVNFD